MQIFRLEPGFAHLHPAYALTLLRKWLFLCLVPLLSPLLAWDFTRLTGVLVQELALIAALVVAVVWVWRSTAWRVDEAGLHLHTGVFLRQELLLGRRQVAVVEVRRSLVLRAMRASRVTVYTKKTKGIPTAQLYLTRQQAQELAQTLLPEPGRPELYRPTGADRLQLVVLSANALATALLVWLTARQTVQLLGDELGGQLQKVTLQNLLALEQLTEQVLPTGLAWLFTLGFVCLGLALGRGLLRTVGLRVCRGGGVLLSRGGLLTLTELRVRASAVTACDICTPPAARLLRRYPVYILAGSYTQADLPILVYQPGREEQLAALLPGLTAPVPHRAVTQGRSAVAFLWAAGGSFALCAVLLWVAWWRLPAMLPVLALFLLVASAGVLVAVQGFFTEDVLRAPDGGLVLRYTRFFTLHNLCVLTRDVSCRALQNPFSETEGRCTLHIRLPGGKKVRLRSMPYYRATQFALDKKREPGGLPG